MNERRNQLLNEIITARDYRETARGGDRETERQERGRTEGGES